MSSSTNVAIAPWKWIVGLGVLVAIALAIAVGTTSGEARPTPTSAFGTPTVTGALLTTLRAGDDPSIGVTAPVAVGTGPDGSAVTIGGEGPQVIAFLAHWCPHCRAEVPVVVDWLDQGGLPTDVQLVAVATSTDEGQPNFPPHDWLDAEGWSAPVLLDDEVDQVGRAFGVSSFPFWVVLDETGTVVVRVTGELTPVQLDTLVELARDGA